MKKIKTESIEDGMTLAEDLAGPNGNIILPMGVSLKSSLISRLTGWGIDEVIIEGDEENTEVESIPLEEYQEHLVKLFINGLDSQPNQFLLNGLIKLKGAN